MPRPPAHSSQPGAESSAQTVWEALALPIRGIELIEVVNKGLSCSVIQRLMTWLDIPQTAGLQCVGISASTWRRRTQTGCLSVQESDRLYRFVSILDLAIELFEGDKAAAYAWLRRPQRGLANHSAIDLLATSAGTEAIRQLIGRLEHGVTP